MKSNKTTRTPSRSRPRRRAPVDESAFTVVLEDIRAQFAVFGEALQGMATKSDLCAIRDVLREEIRGEICAVRGEISGLRGQMHAIRDELRAEIHGLRDELRGDVALLKVAVLELAKR